MISPQQRLTQIDSQVHDLHLSKARNESRREQLLESLASLRKEIEALGIKPGEIDQKIAALELEINEALTVLEGALK